MKVSGAARGRTAMPLVAFLILNSSFFITAFTAHAVEVDGIAARVGESAVLRSEVYAEMLRRNLRDSSQYARVLNELIDRKLILRAAASAKMTMQEELVDRHVQEIVAQSFGGDRNRLVETLAERKVSYPEWRAKVREDMIVSAMRWATVDKYATASPAAMRAEYERHRGDRYASEHKVSVSAIVLKPDERARREDISAAIKTNSFEALGARAYGDVKPEEVFRPEIVAEIGRMPVGTISHWIEIDGWSFLLRKDAETKGEERTFAEAYDDVEAQVKEESAKRLYTEWMRRLRSETYIKLY